MNLQTRVLVIDDRHSLVWFIQRVLQQVGFTVICAYDGADGLRKAREEKPDLIILDTVMPRMNGFEVYHQLQMDKGTAGIPVLFLTIEEGENSWSSGDRIATVVPSGSTTSQGYSQLSRRR